MPSWAPSANNTVNGLLLKGGTLYVKGRFTKINGQDRTYLAALDAAGLLTSWNPLPNNDVEAMVARGNTLVVAGFFTSIAGQARSHLAAFDASGALESWDPTPNNAVRALAVAPTNGTLYVAGLFTQIAAQPRAYLAAFDESGAITPFSPQPDSAVDNLAVGPSAVYFAGFFRNVEGQLDPNGQTTSWSPNLTSAGVRALVLGKDGLLVGGTTCQNTGHVRACGFFRVRP